MIKIFFSYFDGTSNGFYYQVSGSAGWRKSFGKQTQSLQSSNNNSPPDLSETVQKPNQNGENLSDLSSLLVDSSNSGNNKIIMAMNNAAVVTAQRPSQTIRSNTIGGGATQNSYQNNNRNYNYRGKRYDDTQQNLGNNGQQWASTSTARHNVRLPKPAYNKGGGIRSNTDYWHKGGSQSVDTGMTNNAEQQINNKKNDDQLNNAEKNTKAYYQRNDRWQARNPHAPPPLSVAQRKARGPLPDWDEVAESGADEKFDYMDLMETQYSQVFKNVKKLGLYLFFYKLIFFKFFI